MSPDRLSRTRKAVYSVLFFLLLSQGGFHLNGEAPQPYFFIVAADPQLFFQQEDDRNWETTIDHVNRLKPDFVVVCGDLIHAANSPARWSLPEELVMYDSLARAYLRGASRINEDITLYNVAGNHDVSSEPTTESVQWYEERFGSAWYWFEHKRSFFIVLESNVLKNRDGARDIQMKQLTWLTEVLKEASQKDFSHKIAFMHHPLCLKSVEEGDGYFNMPGQPRSELLALLHEHGFEAVFGGHYHRNAYVRDGDLEIITTSSCGVALGDDPLGFRIVKVYPDRLEHQYHSFESMPEKVDLVP